MTAACIWYCHRSQIAVEPSSEQEIEADREEIGEDNEGGLTSTSEVMDPSALEVLVSMTAYTEAPATWIRSALYSSGAGVLSRPAKNVPSLVWTAIYEAHN